MMESFFNIKNFKSRKQPFFSIKNIKSHNLTFVFTHAIN